LCSSPFEEQNDVDFSYYPEKLFVYFVVNAAAVVVGVVVSNPNFSIIIFSHVKLGILSYLVLLLW
jgi:hypothetical protein